MSRNNRNGRNASGDWAEIGLLRDQLLHWLYRRRSQAKARPIAARLAKLLQRLDPDQTAILGQECRSLVAEAAGDLPRAIHHREKEIALIKKLWKVSHGTPAREAALEGYGPTDLADRLDLLAILYHDAGQPALAIRTLRQSKRLCAKHGEPFDGADLLAEYLAEGKRPVASSRRKPA